MTLRELPSSVVFDMDGLLFDTEALYRDAARAAAEEAGRDMPDEVFLGLVGRPWPQNREALLAHYGADFAVDEFQSAWMRHYDRRAAGRVPIKPGVRDLLGLLDDLTLPRAIATSASHDAVRRNLLGHGLEGRFDVVVASGDYACGKPSPDPFLVAAERLGVAPSRCLALEDSHNGVRAAAAAGMTVVMVPDLLPPTAHEQRACAMIAPDLYEVMRAIVAIVRPEAALPRRVASSRRG